MTRCLRSRGEIAQALLDASLQVGRPAFVTELCTHARVGFDAGRYTASRLLSARELVVVEPPSALPGRVGRPASRVLHRELASAQGDDPPGDDPQIPDDAPPPSWADL